MAQNDEIGFELDQWPFYWITRLSAKYMSVLEEELKGGELDVPSWRVLMLLGNGQARSVSYLATDSVIKLSTMTRIIYRMKEQGLVDIRPRETDARVTEVLLTKKGVYSRKIAWLHAQTVVSKALKGVKESEIKQMMTTLEKISLNLDS